MRLLSSYTHCVCTLCVLLLYRWCVLHWMLMEGKGGNNVIWKHNKNIKMISVKVSCIFLSYFFPSFSSLSLLFSSYPIQVSLSPFLFIFLVRFVLVPYLHRTFFFIAICFPCRAKRNVVFFYRWRILPSIYMKCWTTAITYFS